MRLRPAQLAKLSPRLSRFPQVYAIERRSWNMMTSRTGLSSVLRRFRSAARSGVPARQRHVRLPACNEDGGWMGLRNRQVAVPAWPTAMTCKVCDRVTLNAGGSAPFVRLTFQPAGHPEPTGAVNRFVSVCASSRTEFTWAPRRNDTPRDGRAL